ncbi:hypothetical protein Lesp01_83870 [Lentzea sp. NBRC 102530]|nr:hypothetical protein Lesp01_83870 [Lentzea sp. NBRC 102530]
MKSHDPAESSLDTARRRNSTVSTTGANDGPSNRRACSTSRTREESEKDNEFTAANAEVPAEERRNATSSAVNAYPTYEDFLPVIDTL